MAVVALAIVLAVFLGLIAILVGFVNLMTNTSRPKRKKFKSKHAILNPVRERFGAENMRPHRLGQVNVFRPSLEFDYGRTMARLKHVGTPWRGASRQTILETEFDFPGYLRIFSRQPHPNASFGDVMETGDEEFDRIFRIHSGDPTEASPLLTDAVKWKMIELKNLIPGSMEIRIEQDRLRVVSAQWFDSSRSLLDFVQGSLELFDQLMLPRAEGVEFLHQNQAAIIDDFHCPICSDDVMHEMVVCRRCKTPHCAECWEYNGKCATFACMEDRFVRVEEQEL